MRDVGAPSGVRELGYGEDDVERLVEGALKQQRLLVIAPREASEDDLAAIIRESMENWSQRRGRITSDANAEHRVVALEARDRPLDALEAPLAAVVGEARARPSRDEDQQVAGAEAQVALPLAAERARDLVAGGVALGDHDLVPLEVRHLGRGRRPRRAPPPSRSRA